MNIALSTALLFFLVLLPGLIFNRFYYSGVFSKEYFKSNSFEIFFVGFPPGVFIQAMGVYYVHHFTSYTIEFDQLGILLAGKFENNQTVEDIFTDIETSLTPIVQYNLFLWIFAAAAGDFVKFLVRKSRFDLIFKIFRFQNQWHYLISGEMLRFPNVKADKEKVSAGVEFVNVDALMATTEGTIIYHGILEDYYLSKAGGLDAIYLKEVSRRFISTDPSKVKQQKEEGDEHYYHISGEYLVLKYEELLNLNITYYYFKRKGKAKDYSVLLGLAMLTLPIILILAILVVVGWVNWMAGLVWLMLYIDLLRGIEALGDYRKKKGKGTKKEAGAGK